MVSQSPDMKTGPEGPVRAPSAVPVDDAVLPYEVDALDVRGRLVRLGPALDEILTKHDYPAPVGKLLGEAIVLTTLLGSALKFEGRFILQAQTDGPVSFLVVDYQAPDRLRAYARYDAARLGDAKDSGAMLMQFLPKAPERARQADLHPGDAPEGVEVHAVAEDDAWVEARSLIETVEDVELIDPELSGERLLYRLFHERGVRVFNPLPLKAQCSCSRDAVASMLKSFSSDDRAAMVKDDKVVVTCEFCSSVYEFTPNEAGVEDA